MIKELGSGGNIASPGLIYQGISKSGHDSITLSGGVSSDMRDCYNSAYLRRIGNINWLRISMY